MMKINKEYEVKLRISQILNDNGTYTMVVGIENEETNNIISLCNETYNLDRGWIRFEDMIGKYITKILNIHVPKWSKNNNSYFINFDFNEKEGEIK